MLPSRSLPIAAVFAALINAAVWGLSWLPLKYLDRNGVPSLWATFFVFLLCCVAVVAARRDAPRALWQNKALWWLVIAAGGTNACFNIALAQGDVVRCILLFYLMPMWVVPLARWLLNEPVTVSALGRIALALAGASLVLGEGRFIAPIPNSTADWLAVAGGAFFALNNVILRKYNDTPEDARALGMFLGAVFIAPLTIFALSFTAHPMTLDAQPMAWLVIVVFAVFVLIGNLALQYGAGRLPANVLSVLMLAEILVATVSSWLGGEATITAATLIGGALIVSASLLAVFSKNAPAH
jgi:drug/metabolite transporter (DMT)-like permease